MRRREIAILCLGVLALIVLIGTAASGDLVGFMVELEHLTGGR